MLELMEELEYQDNKHIPDHSLLSWQIQLDETPAHPPSLNNQQPPPVTTQFNLQAIPAHFMESKRNEILQLIASDQLNANTMSQKLMDETYSRFCNIVKDEMENNLPKSSNQKHHHHKPWWNQELSEARKGVTIAEREWPTCNSGI